MKDFVTVEQRKKYREHGKKLAILAFYKGILDDLGEKPEAGMKEAALIQATAIVEDFVSRYDAPERVYHTAQHPLVQLLPLSEAEAKELLDSLKDKQIATAKQADELIDRLSKNLSWDAREQQASYNQETASVSSTEEEESGLGAFWRIIRDQLRHDVLQNIKAKTDWRKKPPLKVSQAEMLAPFKKGKVALERVLTDSSAFSKPVELHSMARTSLIPFNISIGTLAAICIFPDGKGEYKKQEKFTSSGLNEWASAIYSVVTENKLREEEGLPPLSAREVLRCCVTLAATVPFKEQGYLNIIASNLKQFLLKPENTAFLKALSIVKENGAPDEEEVRKLIDEMMYEAAKVAERDVGNFKAKPWQCLYDGDHGVNAEIHNLNANSNDLVQQFKLAYVSFSDHATKKEAEERIKHEQETGFLRLMGEENRIYHSYKPLSGGKAFEILQNNVVPLHEEYKANTKKVINAHRFDMALAVAQLAQKNDMSVARYASEENIEAIKNKIARMKKLPENGEGTIQDQIDVEAFCDAVFDSDFYVKYRELLVHPNITSEKDFRQAKGIICRLDGKKSEGKQNPVIPEKMRKWVGHNIISINVDEKILEAVKDQYKETDLPYKLIEKTIAARKKLPISYNKLLPQQYTR